MPPVLVAEPIPLPRGAAPWQVLAALVGGAAPDAPAAWLDSACAHPGLGAWSFAAIGERGDAFELTEQDAGDGLDQVAERLARARGGASVEGWRARRAALGGVPFAGGVVLALSYDLGRRLERVRAPEDGRPAARPEAGFPLVQGFAVAHVLAVEEASGRLLLAGPRGGFEAARARVEAACAACAAVAGEDAGAPASPTGGAAASPRAASPAVTGAPRLLARSFDDEAYRAAVARAQDLIRAGDIFEVNLAQRFDVALGAGDPTRAGAAGGAGGAGAATGDGGWAGGGEAGVIGAGGAGASPGPDAALALYLALRRAAPAPFGALLRQGGRALCSASPERFLRVLGARVEARPIKGTRARGAGASEDAARLAELIGSAKDQAELAMIVDLLRNDLGRVARPGGVRVVHAAEPIAFPQVHHLVGHVEADLAPGRTSLDAVRAAFPCGSITGAPKPRAMEVIDLLEPVRRGPYTGALGWVGADLDLDLAVTIRTIALEGGRAWFSVGGAVTIDSDPALELEETFVKGRALARALGVALPAPGGGA